MKTKHPNQSIITINVDKFNYNYAREKAVIVINYCYKQVQSNEKSDEILFQMIAMVSGLVSLYIVWC